MSTVLRAGFFPENLTIPFRVPAVAGSTLKYDGSISFFDSATFGPVAEQPASSAIPQTSVWAVICFMAEDLPGNRADRHSRAHRRSTIRGIRPDPRVRVRTA